MNYIVNHIINSIKLQNPNKEEQLRIRICGFEDVRIYEAVAKGAHSIYDSSIDVITKLSKEKWSEFQSNPESNQSAMLSMQNHNWIAENNSLTYYRNLSIKEAQLIIIMGTEVVDDQGGLNDFYYIDPERIVADLGKDYYNVFTPVTGGWSDDSIKCVNKLFKDLFALVPINICKLSSNADKWGELPTINDFVELFFKELPNWGLCPIIDKVPTVNKIIKSEKKNLLQLNFDFVSRKLFKSMTQSQYGKYIAKIYKIQHNPDPDEEYSDSWDGWKNQSITSLLQYTNVLCEYIRGEEVDKNRKQLLGVDFTITEHVLNITLPKEIKPRAKKYELTGNPYIALLKAVCASITSDDTDEFNTIKVTFNSIELANAVDPLIDADEEDQLSDSWKKVCWYAGGLPEYISNIDFSFKGTDISVSFDSSSLFNPQYAEKYVSDGLIVKAAASKKLDKVKFEITHYINDEPTSITQNYEWNFTLNDDWVIAFAHLISQYNKWENDQIDSVIPISVVDNYEMLMCAKCEEEFLDAFEQSTFDFKFNIIDDVMTHRENDQAIEWQADFSSLGRSFVELCQNIQELGFFGDLLLNTKAESKAASFIDQYIKLGNLIISKSFNQKLEWVMNDYIHAFSIEESVKSITTDEESSGCIIPPYHPAILQKLRDQTVFLADGCNEWLNGFNGDSASFDTICEMVDELSQLSQIQEGIDIYPGKNDRYFGSTHCFANYCVCGAYKKSSQTRMKTVMKKDAVFDEDFNDRSLKSMNVSARMLFDVLETYGKALPNYTNNLSVAVIDPDDLQPIIAALYHYITLKKKTIDDNNQAIVIRLYILVQPENKGGKNYLSYWANTFFNQDENVDMKIYLNEWKDKDDLEKLLDTNLDLIFLMDVLKVNKLHFVMDPGSVNNRISDCRFPIVFKPAPVSSASIKRSIELTQRQFSAATIHSQVVYYKDNYESYDYKKQLVVREVSIDSERKELILMLHRKSNWVVCVDGGMDGALLRDSDGKNDDYSVIGFSTGKGPHGQYNLTITARTSIIKSVEEKLKSRLRKSFSWDKTKTTMAAMVCMNEARNLDGVSLLSAINPKDQNINEFLAYILASLQAKKQKSKSALQVVIHLDSYQHWFDSNILEESRETKTRPDFLEVSANLGDNGVIKLEATVIECKIAKYDCSDERKKDAINQVQAGIEHLSRIFDPHSESLRRRYWFAQLYRALAFSQITFQSDTKEFMNLADEMRNILEGNFEISWSGKIMGYWKDMQGDSEIVSIISNNPYIELHEVPQKSIQRILLNDESAEVSYVSMPDEDQNQDILEPDVEIDLQNSVDETEANVITDPIQESPIIEEPILVESDTSNDINREKKDEPISEQDTSHEINADKLIKLEDVRVNIGKDKAGNKVYWDFGNPKLANRHLLITGTSGQGKTYSIQTMLKELAVCGISSVIFDYTEGFREDQLEPGFRNRLADKITQNVVYFTGIPINPFRRQEIEIGGIKAPEKVSDVAQRIATIFTHVYNFGEQQFGALYEACREAVTAFGDKTDMNNFKEKLEGLSTTYSKSVLTKMKPFFDCVEFQKDTSFDWNSVIKSNGSVIIFQLTNYVREIQVIITEMMLWDAWHYFKKNGDKNTPFVVVLDEAQNLSMKQGSPAEIILREGRKFGWSAWFATQSLKSLSDSEVVNLHQAAYSIYFKPTDDEITKISKQIDPTSSSSWVSPLKALHKGQCIVTGDRMRTDGSFGPVRPTITNITSFEEREKDEQ